MSGGAASLQPGPIAGNQEGTAVSGGGSGGPLRSDRGLVGSFRGDADPPKSLAVTLAASAAAATAEKVKAFSAPQAVTIFSTTPQSVPTAAVLNGPRAAAVISSSNTTMSPVPHNETAATVLTVTSCTPLTMTVAKPTIQRLPSPQTAAALVNGLPQKPISLIQPQSQPKQLHHHHPHHRQHHHAITTLPVSSTTVLAVPSMSSLVQTAINNQPLAVSGGSKANLVDQQPQQPQFIRPQTIVTHHLQHQPPTVLNRVVTPTIIATNPGQQHHPQLRMVTIPAPSALSLSSKVGISSGGSTTNISTVTLPQSPITLRHAIAQPRNIAHHPTTVMAPQLPRSPVRPAHLPQTPAPVFRHHFPAILTAAGGQQGIRLPAIAAAPDLNGVPQQLQQQHRQLPHLQHRVLQQSGGGAQGNCIMVGPPQLHSPAVLPHAAVNAGGVVQAHAPATHIIQAAGPLGTSAGQILSFSPHSARVAIQTGPLLCQQPGQQEHHPQDHHHQQEQSQQQLVQDHQLLTRDQQQFHHHPHRRKHHQLQQLQQKQPQYQLHHRPKADGVSATRLHFSQPSVTLPLVCSPMGMSPSSPVVMNSLLTSFAPGLSHHHHHHHQNVPIGAPNSLNRSLVQSPSLHHEDE